MSQDSGGVQPEWRRLYEQLIAQIAVNRGDIDALLAQAHEASLRAANTDDAAQTDRVRIDDLEARADASNNRAAKSDDAVQVERVRIDHLEERTGIDRELIAELQADGTLRGEHVLHLEQALRSSRTIGAAIGIVMGVRKVDEGTAFKLLVTASKNTNRKLRVLAEEIVLTGDISKLPRA